MKEEEVHDLSSIFQLAYLSVESTLGRKGNSVTVSVRSVGTYGGKVRTESLGVHRIFTYGENSVYVRNHVQRVELCGIIQVKVL